MDTKRSFVLLLVVAMFLSVLIGCSTTPSVTTTTASTTVAEAPVTLVLDWTNVPDNVVGAWAKLWVSFNEENPNIFVSFNAMPNINETIRVQVSAGAGPDMMMMDAFDVLDFAKAGHLVELEESATSLGWKDVIYGWAYKSCSYEDKLYAMPWSSEMTTMQVNMKLIQKYGWKVPTTRSEFEEVCDAALAEGIIPIAYGFSGLPLLNQWIYDHYINGYAGADTLVAILKNEKKWTDPLIVESFNLMKADWDKGYFQDKMSQAITSDEANSMFLSGKALFDTQGTWFPFNRTDAECESETMSLAQYLWPSMRDGVAATFSQACGEVIGVNTYGKHHDQVIIALDYLMKNDEAVAKAVGSGVIPPPRKIDPSLVPDTATIGVKLGMKVMSGFPEQTQNQGFAPWGFYPTSCNQYMYENMDKILLGTITVEEYLGNAQIAFEKDLQDGYKFAGG